MRLEKRSFRRKRILLVPSAARRCLNVYAVAVIASLWAFASLAGAEETASLRTLTLEESLKLAEAQHPQVIAAREERRAAEGGVVEARSGFYPHLQASAGLFHLEEPPTLALGPLTARMGRENMGFINVGATQTLYAGGRIRDGLAIAALSGEAAEERLRAVRDEIALQTKRDLGPRGKHAGRTAVPGGGQRAAALHGCGSWNFSEGDRNGNPLAEDGGDFFNCRRSLGSKRRPSEAADGIEMRRGSTC